MFCGGVTVTVANSGNLCLQERDLLLKEVKATVESFTLGEGKRDACLFGLIASKSHIL